MLIPNQSNTVVVTAAQMQAIESLMLEAGIPVAALIEKVAGRITQRLELLYPASDYPRVGVLVGSGHNGGDALVVARELAHKGRQVQIYLPLSKFKPLTQSHWQYAQSLGIKAVELEDLQNCDLIVDGLFGFGLERELTGEIAHAVNTINTWHIPILSIDLPSGINTDTGLVMGTAIQANYTLCLGLWKRGLLTENAASCVGHLERVDFDIPNQYIEQVLGSKHQLWRIEPQIILAQLRKPRLTTVHKYQIGHLLLVVGSHRYGGAAILAALGAKASGVGMLSIAVPKSLRELVLAQVPDALVIACEETASGAIAQLPALDLAKYSAIACGCGLSLDALTVVQQILVAPCPVVIDADGLNLLAQLGTIANLTERTQTNRQTILTPHWGEFCRLFPELSSNSLQQDRLTALETAATQTKATILLKGARTAISFHVDLLDPTSQQTWINPESTPALARGGSGDVLTGMIGGLWAQHLMTGQTSGDVAIAATVWHSQTAIWLANQRTEMGVDPVTLAQNLCEVVAKIANLAERVLES